jgi:hypothetical protein
MKYNLFIELTSCNDVLIHLVLLLEYVFFFLHYSNLPSTSFKLCSGIIYVPTGIAMCNLNKYMSVQCFRKDKLPKIAYPNALQTDQTHRLFHHFNAIVKWYTKFSMAVWKIVPHLNAYRCIKCWVIFSFHVC